MDQKNPDVNEHAKKEEEEALPKALKTTDIEGGEGDNPENEKLPYPKSVFFIVSNEFCERFSFYGMRTILSIYLKNQLNFHDNTATVIYHAFIMICYFFPFLGAIVADSFLGKYKTILYLSIVYALGNIIVSTAAIPNTIPPVLFTMLGLVLIALGTGGIKPCVAAFGGDQFKRPQQEDQLKKFFSIFYFSINCGSFVSTFLTPILREVKCFGQDSCFSLAFGVPAVLMILSIVIYFSGKRFYKIKEPEGNVVVKVGACVWHAITNKTTKTYDHWLDKAQDKYDKGLIDDIKATLNVLVLYIPLPIFWALFDQQGSRWTFQATRMNGEVGSFKIRPDQMQVVNPVLILAFIPLFDTVIYPIFAKCNLLKKPLQRLIIGGMLAALAFGISALIEIQLEPTYAVLPKAGEAQLRFYNALPKKVQINASGIENEIILPSLEMSKTFFIPLSGSKSFQIKWTSVNLETKTSEIILNEKQAVSYTFLQGRSDPFPIVNEDIDKSLNGNPKVRVVYSDEKFTEQKVIFYDTYEKKDIFFATLTETTPYCNYSNIPLSDDKYNLKLNGKTVLENIELKLGGVYNILVSKVSGAKPEYKAKVFTVTQPNSVHILYLIPQYVIITAGEVMFSITGLDFSFSQAPSSMKSLLQAFWLLTVGVGNLIVVIIAEAKLFERQTFEFLLFAGLMFLDMVIFAVMAMRYKYVEVRDESECEEDEKK